MMAGQLQRKAEALETQRADATAVVYRALDDYTPNVAAALPQGFPGGVRRFQRILRTAVSSNPRLLECTPRSVVAGAILCAQLGLTPNLMGQAWLIPRRNKKNGGLLEASFQIGYKGLIELAGRANVHVRADTVKVGDYYIEEGGLVPRLEHVKAGRGHPLAPAQKRGEAFLWYAVLESPYWSAPRCAGLDREEVEVFRAESGDPNGTTWTKWYDEMAMSKAIRVAGRYVRVSVEFDNANRSDDTILELEEVLALARDDEAETAVAAGEPDATPTVTPQLEQAAGAPVDVLDATTKDTAAR